MKKAIKSVPWVVSVVHGFLLMLIWHWPVVLKHDELQNQSEKRSPIEVKWIIAQAQNSKNQNIQTNKNMEGNRVSQSVAPERTVEKEKEKAIVPVPEAEKVKVPSNEDMKIENQPVPNQRDEAVQEPMRPIDPIDDLMVPKEKKDYLKQAREAVIAPSIAPMNGSFIKPLIEGPLGFVNESGPLVCWVHLKVGADGNLMDYKLLSVSESLESQAYKRVSAICNKYLLASKFKPAQRLSGAGGQSVEYTYQTYVVIY